MIDSCIHNGVALPLAYLRAVDAQDLAFAFLSHPHTDHFKGLDEVLKAYPKVRIVGRYDGNSVKELKTYWYLTDFERSDRISDALGKVFKAIDQARSNGARFVTLSEMKSIYNQTGSINGKRYQTLVTALSPSADSQDMYYQVLRRAIPRPGKRLKHLRDNDHNLIASAIWVQVNNLRILLGSDLEKGGKNTTGWKGVVSIPGCPNLEIGILKVAHHGASSAHHQPAWTMHRKGRPTALLTPWCVGDRTLPTSSDVTRIKGHCQRVGITGNVEFEGPSTKYEDVIVRQVLYDFRKWRIRKTSPNAGYLQVRYDLDGKLIHSIAVPPSQWLP